MPELNFSDSVIAAYCPEAITYHKARENMKFFLQLRGDKRGGGSSVHSKKNTRSRRTGSSGRLKSMCCGCHGDPSVHEYHY